MIEDLGYHVVEASSGSEALAALARGENFDVVLTDQAMPGMTGLQLAAAISEISPSLPIILGTGYAQLPDGADTGLRRLAKPFGQEMLDRVLIEVLHRPAEKGEPLSLRQAEGDHVARRSDAGRVYVSSTASGVSARRG